MLSDAAAADLAARFASSTANLKYVRGGPGGRGWFSKEGQQWWRSRKIHLWHLRRLKLEGRLRGRNLVAQAEKLLREHPTVSVATLDDLRKLGGTVMG